MPVMKKSPWGLILIFCTALAASLPSHAAFIDVRTSAGSVQSNATFDVIFSVSGLTGAADDSLSGFDLDVLFDTTFLSFVSGSFVNGGGGSNQLALPEPGAFAFFGDAVANAGRIDAFGLSGNSAAVLDGAQAGAFDFLTLQFLALAETAATTISIDLTDPNLLFVDSTGGDLPVSLRSTAAQVSIATSQPPTSVPEPGAASLLLIGLALTLASRTRARKLRESSENRQEHVPCV
jgi:hypothetical protein